MRKRRADSSRGRTAVREKRQLSIIRITPAGHFRTDKEDGGQHGGRPVAGELQGHEVEEDHGGASDEQVKKKTGPGQADVLRREGQAGFEKGPVPLGILKQVVSWEEGGVQEALDVRDVEVLAVLVETIGVEENRQQGQGEEVKGDTGRP